MTTTPSSYTQYETLRDRAVLVTGGGSGIGAAIVSHFARQGSRVAFIDVDSDASNLLVENLASQNARHKPMFVHCDVTELDGFTSAVKSLDREFNGIDVLVNNAASDQRHSIAEVTPEFWRNRMAVNLDHQFFAAQTVAAGMSERRRGSIINMGSCSWRLGLGDLSAYVTAKAAIEGLTNGLARELGAHGVRVNCVVPGFIKTERQVKLWLTPELENTILEGQCLKELIDPIYVANLIAFLASDDARMCSSGTYTVDGGWI